jgi:hypothetical protein
MTSKKTNALIGMGVIVVASVILVLSLTSTPHYALATCKQGDSKTVGNGRYTVGTDIAQGSYKIESKPAGIDWTNISVYDDFAQYKQMGEPSNEQTSATQSFNVMNNQSNVTTLHNGQYMVVDADPATFTCQ